MIVFEDNPFLDGQLLDNLEYLYAAAETDPTAAEWTLIGTGHLPVGAYGLALDFDPKWKRAKGNRWVSSSGEMEVTLPGPQFLIAGTGDTAAVAQRLGSEANVINLQANVFTQTLLEKTHPGVVVFFSRLGGLLPVELPAALLGGSTLLVSGDFSGEVLVADFVFTFDSPVRARVAGVVIRTIGISESRKEEGGLFAGAGVTVGTCAQNTEPAANWERLIRLSGCALPHPYVRREGS